ncbi:MAG: DUF262 domain-containing protein [Prolixibacteraceae bacterium]|nr:DUF262 domain-containing protein [Prolixibacteraceae bacterium]
MNLPEPITRTFSGLIADIEQGQIKIPQFQRDFVWDIKKSANLMDSIVKGYPIGTFIFWRTKERLRTIRDIGNFSLPEPQDGEFIDFVLDGQQRLTSLFASLKGLKVERDNKTDDYSRIYINLNGTEDSEIVTVDVDDLATGTFIKLTELLYGGLTLLAGYDPKYHKLIEAYKQRIESYNYSIIQIKEAPIDTATEIFTRINVGGKPLSLFEIMVAKTYDAERKFDLSEKYNQLIDNLRPVNYETLSDATVLQTVSIILTKDCTRKQILRLDKKSVIDIWELATDSIERAIEYFRGFYRIPVSQLLPYNALVVPFAYFFYHHKDKPTGLKQQYLQDFFWRVSLVGRYSSAVESKLAQDIKRIDLILEEKLPKYEWSINVSTDFISEHGWFSAGRSFIKGILCIYAYQLPKSFNDNSIVNISNYWLKQANSKNYHHFFPKAYLIRENRDSSLINHIANITIVDDFLNKREIKANAPSKYMAKFKRVNPSLDETMKTHLIKDLEKFGIWDDDYDKFFKARLQEISAELKKRIIEQDVDREIETILHDDYEEDEQLLF